MAAYAVQMNRTASTSASLGSIGAATRPRRSKWYDIILGSEATPADNSFLYLVQRYTTTAGTSSAVTPQPLDPGDAATESVAGENHSGEPTYTSNAVLLAIALNQRATFRWVAAPGCELVTPATASTGLGIQTPTASAVAISATVQYVEQ